MAAIRGKGNKSTELKLRMALVRAGLGGWTTHPKDVFGKPDFFFPSQKVAVFVDGCFWHGCAKCGHIPKTNQSFWTTKIERNRKRHRRVNAQLKSEGIHVRRFWEHALRCNLDQAVSKLRRDLYRGSKKVPFAKRT
jgi:DNA mismatch endonuclease (patch repair protein)